MADEPDEDYPTILLGYDFEPINDESGERD